MRLSTKPRAPALGGLAPLTNEGALGFLFWGVLRQDEYWIKAQ